METQLEPKTVKESSVVVSCAVMPSDANPAGVVHGGVIMKHIDNTGAMVAVRHSRHFCVTASVDRLDFHNPGFIGELLTFKSSLNLVGKSSMEIGVRVEAENLISGEVRHIASAYLTYVCLGENRKPTAVPGLILETEADHRRNREAIQRRRVRIQEKNNEAAK